MNTWNNGERGDVVKKIIEGNFLALEKAIGALKIPYVKDFKANDWSSGIIFINHTEHKKENPTVELYMKGEHDYSVVLGGYTITDYGIELHSDIHYEGRVVIK